MAPDFRLTAITGLDEGLAPLREEADRDGHRFVTRLVNDWASGVNRFDAPGEHLMAAVRNGLVLGVCGLNRDPYTAETGVGRLAVVSPDDGGKVVGIVTRSDLLKPRGATVEQAVRLLVADDGHRADDPAVADLGHADAHPLN